MQTFHDEENIKILSKDKISKNAILSYIGTWGKCKIQQCRVCHGHIMLLHTVQRDPAMIRTGFQYDTDAGTIRQEI